MDSVYGFYGFSVRILRIYTDTDLTRAYWQTVVKLPRGLSTKGNLEYALHGTSGCGGAEGEASESWRQSEAPEEATNEL
jgi:hypothetical protein